MYLSENERNSFTGVRTPYNVAVFQLSQNNTGIVPRKRYRAENALYRKIVFIDRRMSPPSKLDKYIYFCVYMCVKDETDKQTEKY